MSGSWEDTLIKSRQVISSGAYDKLFSDNYFIFDLIKLLYSESTDERIKLELLVLIEEFSQEAGVQTANVDQIVQSLLDVCHQLTKRGRQFNVTCQILTTLTTILILYDQQDTDVCQSVVQTLLATISNGVNVTENRLLHSTACQCLTQLEEDSPGLLWREKDSLIKLMRQERTSVYEDYVMLVTKVLQHGFSATDGIWTKGKEVDRVVPLDPAEYRQIISQIMDNTSLFTQGGLWHIVLDLVNIVQNYHEISATVSVVNIVLNYHEISATIFKPMMLHYMSTFDTALLHLVVFIQSEFEMEVLTDVEEKQLQNRLLAGLNHPSLIPAQQLFYCHWIECLSHVTLLNPDVSVGICDDQHQVLFPSVFDPIDCQLAKLGLLNFCFPSLVKEDNGKAAAMLLAGVGYLHKLVWHTGSPRAAKALFRALFSMYRRHCSKSFSQDINRFLRGLISGFPFFIPQALDFIESLREMTPDSPVYLEILRLLHHQVISTPQQQAAQHCYFYLQVLKRASLQTEIPPQGTVRFLSYLAENSLSIDEGSWRLGTSILVVCQNILVCHGTRNLYTDIGDLLFYLMVNYRDTDIKDKARFYYMLITSSTDEKICMIIQPTTDSHLFHQEAISNLLPNNKARGHSSVVDLEKSIFHLEKLKVQAEFFWNNDYKDTDDGKIGDLKTYYQTLNKYRTVLKTVHRISLAESGPKGVLALCIYFEDDSSYQPVKEVRFPRINKEALYKFDLDIIPLIPLPTKKMTRCEFVDGDQTFRCRVSDLDIAKEDLFFPLPVEITSPADKERDFQTLWDWLAEDVKQEGSTCLESVMTVQKPMANFLSSVKPCLRTCQVSQGADFVKYGVFLPPNKHLLISVTSQNDYVIMKLITDFYQSLLFIRQLI
ncbi:AP-5 complex subunit beta-1-like isoform X2 [Ostrea edulis]|uniref:AP-5 complex subunit beta-1-like isoform X2 n=1 Tax=Ostrea edulis TaxID=37623 RepID=UPI0024AF6638|nr:AP-5 complex subunit beta-1-like isoform X2 [Ostrea edulis]